MSSQVGRPRDTNAGNPVSWTSPLGIRRPGLARLLRGTSETSRRPDQDAYLLVMLADQELTAGRDDQAQSLLDAAYAAFDWREQRPVAPD